MPAASRVEMQECGKSLLIRNRQSKTGKMTLLKRQAFRLSSSVGHQSHNRIPKSLSVNYCCAALESANTEKWESGSECLWKSWLDLSMSGAVNQGCVMGSFCLDEKHHWDLNEATGEVQERASWYNKGNVLLALNRLVCFVNLFLSNWVLDFAEKLDD